MKCNQCGAGMKTRNGRYGQFLYCPSSTPADNHGTCSVIPEGPEEREIAQMFDTRIRVGSPLWDSDMLDEEEEVW